MKLLQLFLGKLRLLSQILQNLITHLSHAAGMLTNNKAIAVYIDFSYARACALALLLLIRNRKRRFAVIPPDPVHNGCPPLIKFRISLRVIVSEHFIVGPYA